MARRMYSQVNYSPTTISLSANENQLSLVVATRRPCKVIIDAPVMAIVARYAPQAFPTFCHSLGLRCHRLDLPILTPDPCRSPQPPNPHDGPLSLAASPRPL
ncbi:hypothetical protein ACLOJK_035151, partial [Asimina triloba]